MTSKFRKYILAMSFALIAFLASALPVVAQNSHYSLRMENNTGYDIYQVRLSSVYQIHWPDDLLGASSIFWDGTSFTINQIAPGRYDLAFVDEDGDLCIVNDVAIYQNLNWSLSERWLLSCER